MVERGIMKLSNSIFSSCYLLNFFLEVMDDKGGKQTLNPFFHVIYPKIYENVSYH